MVEQGLELERGEPAAHARAGEGEEGDVPLPARHTMGVLAALYLFPRLEKDIDRVPRIGRVSLQPRADVHLACLLLPLVPAIYAAAIAGQQLAAEISSTLAERLAIESPAVKLKALMIAKELTVV